MSDEYTEEVPVTTPENETPEAVEAEVVEAEVVEAAPEADAEAAPEAAEDEVVEEEASAPVVVVPDAVTGAGDGAVNGAGREPPTVVVADASPLGGELARAAEVLRALETRAPRA